MHVFGEKAKPQHRRTTTQTEGSPCERGVGERKTKKQKSQRHIEKKPHLPQDSRKLGWQKQQVSQSYALASGETTTLSLTVTLLINTPASAGGIIAPASPVILYLTCCYCQTPSPLRETERQREKGGVGCCGAERVCSEVAGRVGVACVLSR